MRIKSFALAVVLAAVPVFFLTSCSKNAVKRDEYVLSIDYYDGGVLDVALIVNGTIKEENAEKIRFNLYPAAYKEGAKITPLKEGDKAGDLSIREVTIGGKSAKFSFGGKDGNVLVIDTDGSYKKGDAFSIGIKYTAILAESDERFSVSGETVNLGNFFPMLCVYDGEGFVECDYGSVGDPFVSECADFRVSLTVPAEYTVASGFDAKSLDSGLSRCEYRYEASSVRDVAFTINKNYRVLQKKWGDKSVNYYFYADDDSEETINVAIEALGYFSEKFGRYPYDTFTFAETSFEAAGMEYPCFAMIADDLDRSDRLFATVHEIAHQWWYGLVGNDQIKEAYLDESLAEYSTYAFFSDNGNPYVDAESFLNETKNGCIFSERAFTKLYEGYLPKIDRRLDEFYNAYDYYECVYAKGFLMMKAAEDAVGRKKLCSLLKKYCEKYRYKIASGKDFLACMGGAKPIIESYLCGKTSAVGNGD